MEVVAGALDGSSWGMADETGRGQLPPAKAEGLTLLLPRPPAEELQVG